MLSISGEDVLSVQRKFKPDWIGRLPTRFLILTNELPQLSDASGTIAGRFVILTMTRSFYGDEDPELTARLLTEAPAIFNWALEGLDRLTERGHFIQPQASAAALQQLRDLASPVSAFVRDRCTIDPEAVTLKTDLWKSWKEWCDTEGARSGTNAILIRNLRAAYPNIVPGRRRDDNGNRTNVLYGISLALEGTPDTPDRDATENVRSGVADDEGLAQPSRRSGMSGVDPSVFVGNGQSECVVCGEAYLRDEHDPRLRCEKCSNGEAAGT